MVMQAEVRGQRPGCCRGDVLASEIEAHGGGFGGGVVGGRVERFFGGMDGESPFWLGYGGGC